jgi:purine-binding chemotaxis protein CheW
MKDATQYCSFFVDNHYFGIDVCHVQEVIRYQQMTPVPLAPDGVEGLINLRGQIVTAIDLRRRLGMAVRPKARLPMNVVIRADDNAVSLLVDEIGDVVELDRDTHEAAPPTVKGSLRQMISGVHKLEKELLFVLDTHSITSLGATPMEENKPS